MEVANSARGGGEMVRGGCLEEGSNRDKLFGTEKLEQSGTFQKLSAPFGSCALTGEWRR